MTGAVRGRNRALHWRTLLTTAAGILAALLLGLGLVVRDRETAVLGLLTIAGVALLRVRRGRLGAVVLGLLCADIAAWLVPAAVDNIRHHDRLGAIAVPVVVRRLCTSAPAT